VPRPAALGQQHIRGLAAQQYDYLLEQLKGLQGADAGPTSSNMTRRASAFTPQDIELLVDYLAGLGAQ